MAFNVVLRSVVLSVWIAVFLSMTVISLQGAWGDLDYMSCDNAAVPCYDQRLFSRCALASPNDTFCRPFIDSMIFLRSDYMKVTPVIYYFDTFFKEVMFPL
ncbi:hypothetical protein COOONC_01415 [Cooperia oncophora]